VDRTAWVLRNDQIDRSFVPPSKLSVLCFVSSSGGLTDTTICSETVPSFRISLRL